MWWRNQKENWNGQGCFSELAENCENSKLSLDIRKQILDCYVKPILTYGSFKVGQYPHR